MSVTIIGLDIAKSVFQVHGADGGSQPKGDISLLPLMTADNPYRTLAESLIEAALRHKLT